METLTAPSAWRAISPVSMVTVWEPYGKDLLTTLKLQSSIGNFFFKTGLQKHKGRSLLAAALGS